VVISEPLPDYYAVLQVHPDADQEVIEAAYRQLMKKHHPDLAGDDPRQVSENHRRATQINRAFAVLRDPDERRRYDFMRQVNGTRRPPSGTDAARPQPASSRPAPPPHDRQTGPNARAHQAQPPPQNEPPVAPPPQATVEMPAEHGTLPPPLSWLATAYYLLPGTYEWERGTGRELLGVLLLPVVGTAAFALATGRLSHLLGPSLGATVMAWLVLVLLSLPLLQSFPRVAVACGPGIVLLTGTLNPTLTQAHVPIWLAWAATALVALLLAARLYVFGFLPTLALCWLLSRT
jgi:hypothetical protein